MCIYAYLYLMYIMHLEKLRYFVQPDPIQFKLNKISVQFEPRKFLKFSLLLSETAQSDAVSVDGYSSNYKTIRWFWPATDREKR